MRLGRALRAGVLVLLALGPFLLAAAASRPDVPEAAPTSVGDIPPLPEGGDEVDLTQNRFTLPLVVEDLPDRASRDALAAYEGAGIFEPDVVLAAFEAAIAALVVDEANRPALAEMAAGLLDTEVGVAAIPGALRDALGEDDRNRDRMTNAATMLFAYGALLDAGIAQTPETSPRGYPFHAAAVEANAAALLDFVGELFGPSPIHVLNRAFIESLTNYKLEGTERVLELAAEALDLAGDDVTTRLAVADLQARQPDDPTSWEHALETLDPLLSDEETELAGRIARGDAYLAAASLRSYEAPRTAAVLARRAVVEYDRVLRDTADAGVYAGRARALAIVGDVDSAREALDRAIELAPDSIDLRMLAAGLAEAASDLEAMWSQARDAFELTNAGWNPRVSRVRFVPGVEQSLAGFAHPGNLGMSGASVGSTLDHVALIRTPQGGGLVADVEVVPAVVDPARDLWRRSGFQPDVTTYTAVQAAIALADADGAYAQLDAWSTQPISRSQELVDAAFRDMQELAWTVDFAATGELPLEAIEDFSGGVVVTTAEATLRRAGEFRTAEELCQGLVDAGTDDVQPSELHRCVGDARYLQDDDDGAVTSYGAAIDEAGFLDARLLTRRGAVVLSGDPGNADARNDLAQAAVFGEGGDRGTALVFLAGDELVTGEVAAANAHYDLALALLDPNLVDSDDQAARAGVRQARVQALINRGVASLRLAQDDPNQPPRCTSDEARPRCETAEDDFEDALAVDSLNPIALMDLGWVARSRGDLSAAREALQSATDADPSLFPALNDLGVLAAQDGDGQAARRAFHSALAARPTYALGWWNLGVLELDGGVSGLRAGQAALARAIELDPSLAGHRADYRTDEAVYRAAFDGLQDISGGWPVARTYGLAAAVLGGVGLLTALGRLTRTFVGEAWTTAADLLTDPSRGGRRKRRLIARIRLARSRLPDRVARWAPWLGAGVVLAIVTAVTVWVREPVAILASFASVAVATAAAIVVHERAHALALRRYGGRLLPAQWGPGAALAVLLLPVQASSGPYLGERVEDAAEERLVRIHAAGPVANLALAAVAFGVYLLRPTPILLLTAQVSLAVSAYTLLPNPPLDGKVLAERTPVLAALLGLLVVSAGVAFTIAV